MRASRSTSCADGASGGRGGRRSTPSSPSRRTRSVTFEWPEPIGSIVSAPRPRPASSSARSRGSRTTSGARLRPAASAAVSTMSRSRSRRGAPARGALGDRHSVRLGGAVVDPERAELRGEARERQLVGHAEPAAQLHRAVDHAADGLGDEDLRDTRLVTRGLACIEHLGAAADQRPARIEVDHAVGDQGLGDALLVEAPSEQLAPGRVVEGHVERAAREAEPPHAVGQARRREAHLRQPEAEPDLSQDGIVADAAVVEHDLGVPTRERAVDGADEPLDAHTRVRLRHDEHRRAAVADELVVGARHADRERGAPSRR